MMCYLDGAQYRCLLDMLILFLWSTYPGVELLGPKLDSWQNSVQVKMETTCVSGTASIYLAMAYVAQFCIDPRNSPAVPRTNTPSVQPSHRGGEQQEAALWDCVVKTTCGTEDLCGGRRAIPAPLPGHAACAVVKQVWLMRSREEWGAPRGPLQHLCWPLGLRALRVLRGGLQAGASLETVDLGSCSSEP